MRLRNQGLHGVCPMIQCRAAMRSDLVMPNLDSCEPAVVVVAQDGSSPRYSGALLQVAELEWPSGSQFARTAQGILAVGRQTLLGSRTTRFGVADSFGELFEQL